MRFVGCLDQLVQASELSPNMAMPKMVGLIKQLRKELDPQKVIKSANTNRKKGKFSSLAMNTIIRSFPSMQHYSLSLSL